MGFTTTRFARTPALDEPDAAALRARIREYFHDTADRYERLYEVLSAEGCLRRSISLRHPLIFYLGHTATFFVNKLLLAGLLTERINPHFESMFAIGVDEMSWDDLDSAHYDWPPLDAVYAYRARVRRVVDDVLRDAPLTTPVRWDDPWWSIVMGIEHERIHLETSSVLIRQQRLDLVRPHPAWPICDERGEAPDNAFVKIPAGEARIGKPRSDRYYGWDNEYGEHRAPVAAFEASRHLVSNGEYRAFVDAGGYEDRSLWEQEGREWLAFANAKHPTFWIRDGERWRLRLMTEVVEMPWSWPVETNCHEARAFCAWKSRREGRLVRLPSEDEWYRLLAVAGVAEVPDDAPAAANLHLDRWASPCPVDRFAHGPLFDVVGNVWQWTETPIAPFAGFVPHEVYDDFSVPTFDGRHNLIKGGSWISTGNEARHASRYAFRRHFFQHAGFRYVTGEPLVPQAASRYETDRLLSEYAEFHYGDEHLGVPNFPRALAELAVRAMGSRPAREALDLGCATGRATFELARHFERVTGIDFSARFIELGARLAEHGSLRYTRVEEGELTSDHERRLADMGLDAVRGKVAFLQGDACNLKPLFAGYDLILAANLIDRLYDPRKLLDSIHERINPGGLLVLASPYTWLTEHTPREAWIGGFEKDGRRVTTLDGLKTVLGARFRLVGEPVAVPFVLRETRNKFQHTLSEVTVWERRDDTARGLVAIRRATLDDLPAIHALIRESFDALNDHVGPGLEEVWRRQSSEVIERGDLSPAAFEREYLARGDAQCFLVAVHPELGVVGCIALKRTNDEEAELVRMAVTSRLRSQGLGARLVDELRAFAVRTGAKRIRVVTGNPSAARFYERMGFVPEHDSMRIVRVDGREFRVWVGLAPVAGG